ncbi:MAG TPA: hypothetical protein VIM79_22765 [Niastella sp.]
MTRRKRKKVQQESNIRPGIIKPVMIGTTGSGQPFYNNYFRNYEYS